MKLCGNLERKWTTEEIIVWLESAVELPQYKRSFEYHEVSGLLLPRLEIYLLEKY